MRYLGIDYGTVRIGISISDTTNTIATSIGTIKNNEKLLDNIFSLIDKFEISKIILGNPLNMDGSFSKKSEEVLKLKKEIENNFNIEVILQDERLTTVISEKVLIESNMRRNKRKKVIDSMASSLILQAYLDKEKQNEK